MTLQMRMTEIADCDRGTDDDGNYTDTGYTWDVIDMDDKTGGNMTMTDGKYSPAIDKDFEKIFLDYDADESEVV